MKNELKRHKKSDSVKWLLVTVAVILLAVAVTAAITSGFKNWNPYGWLDKPQKEETESRTLKASARSFSEAVPENADSLEEWTTLFDIRNSQIEGAFDGDPECELHMFPLNFIGVNSVQLLNCWYVTVSPKSDLSDITVYIALNYALAVDYIDCSFDFIELAPECKANLKAFTGLNPGAIECLGLYNTMDGTFVDRDRYPYLYSYIIRYKGSPDIVNRYASRAYAAGCTYKYLSFVCGKVLSLPEEPTKEGYTFIGWYLDEDLTVPYNGEPITAEMNFYAKFEINTFTVSFDCVGGSRIEDMTVDWNTSLQFPAPIRTGYNFLGWYMRGGTKYEGQAVTADMRLTAKWEIKTFTVTFIVGGEVYSQMTVDYGTVLTDLINTIKEQNLQVTSVRSTSGAEIADFTQMQVTEDYEVNVQEMTGADKAVNTVKTHWLSIVLSAGLLVAVIAVVCALIPKKKLHRR